MPSVETPVVCNERRKPHTNHCPSSNKKQPTNGFRTFQQKTFWQKNGGGHFGKKYAKTSQAKNICRNVSYDMWGISGVCTLVLTVAKTSSHYDRFASRSPFPLGLCSLKIEVVNDAFFKGHGIKFERISSNFNFEWTKFEFSKNRNKFESMCSNFELSKKRSPDISPFHLVPRAPWGRLCSHLAKRSRTGAKT